MSERLVVKGRVPTYSEIVLHKLMGIFEGVAELSAKFKTGFTRNKNQKDLRLLIESSSVPIDRSIHVLVYGNPGSGKTWAVLGEAWDLLCSYPGTNALVVRKTAAQAAQGPFADSINILNRLNIPFTKNQSPSATWIRLSNGSTMQFKSDKALVDTKSVKSHAIGGMAYSIVILEEVDSISEELANSLPGRLRQTGEFRRIIFYVCNPPDEYHWVHKKFWGTPVEPKSPDDPSSRWRAIQCNVENNELAREGFKLDMEEDFGENEALAATLGKGEFGPQGGGYPVFQDVFDKTFHVSADSILGTWNPSLPILRSWDFGWHGMCMICAQDDVHRKQIRIYVAKLEKYRIFSNWLDEMIEYCDRTFIDSNKQTAHFVDYCDQAGTQILAQTGMSYIDVMKDRGLNPTYQYQEIKPGIVLISDLLRETTKGRPYVLFNKVEAKPLVDAMWTGYCIEKNKMGKEYSPVKDGTYDHLADTFRYLIINIRKLGNLVPRTEDKNRWATSETKKPQQSKYIRRSLM